MKKILIILLIPLLLSNMNGIKKEDDLIRIRVIANSNSKYDQNIKNIVSSNLKLKLYNLLKEEKDINNARKIIKNNINTLESTIKKDLINEDYSFSINYGLNYFPEKEYNGKKYEEGKYESLLVTLGKGEGNNWWCILFPPICLIEAEESNQDVEYSSFFKTIIDKVLH